MDKIKLVSGKSKNFDFISKSDSNSKSVQSKIAYSQTNKTTQNNSARPKKNSPASKTSKVKKTKNGSSKAIIIAAIIAAVIFAAFFGLGAYANGLETIFPNVSMEGTDLSGMTVSEAADILVANSVGTAVDKELIVSLPAGCEMTISAKDAGCYLSAPDAAVFAYDACHGGSFIRNTASYIKCLFSGMAFNASSGEKLDEDYLSIKIDEGVKQVSLALMQSNVEIKDDSLTVVKGASAVRIDSDKLYDTVREALVSGNYDPIKYTAEAVDGTKTEELDLQELYDTIYEEPVNAEYDPETQQATEHVVGRSFDIEEAKMLWDEAENGDSVVIPLILTDPEITTEKLNSMLFADLLAQKSTGLTGSSAARINNITKATASINGIVLNPGEEFSYNQALGQRTVAAGYQAAGAYSGGQVVQEVGGGICQVSSTLYFCALISNLEITDRSCHYFGVSYLPAGLDATVSWPTPDFKFKNDGEYPIKIQASVDKTANTMVIKIYGSNPDEIRVEMTTATWQLADGYGAASYRWVYDKDGNLISKTEEARSRYYYHVDPSPSPDESPSPSPDESSSPSPDASPSPSVTESNSPSPGESPTPTPTESVSPSPSAPVQPASGSDISVTP